MEPTELDNAYAAGFFDGDGTCCITPSNGGTSLTVAVGITQKDREVLDWFATTYGGNVVPERDRYWRWRPPHKEAFLRQIFPYLKYKHERVEKLLTLYYDKTQPRGWGYEGRRVPEDVVQSRRELIAWFKSQTLATTGKPSTLVGR